MAIDGDDNLTTAGLDWLRGCQDTLVGTNLSELDDLIR